MAFDTDKYIIDPACLPLRDKEGNIVVDRATDKKRMNMADIELVIKIPENIYNLIVKGEDNRDFVYKSDLMRAILEGTPLPKGHKRLIVEPTEEDIAKTVGGQSDFAECIRDAVRMIYVNTPTIIEADKS